MTYFVTGATGFIGRFLVEKLLERNGQIFVLVREGSLGKLEELRLRWGQPDRVVPVIGDLASPLLGLTQDQQDELSGSIDHFFHLAAVYDMTAPDELNEQMNVGGTRNAVDLANAIDAGTLHHVSSIAAAGLYKGLFREDMFDEGQKLDHPYHRTKFESEKLARNHFQGPWRVYRPAVVVSSAPYRAAKPDLIIMALTSQAHQQVSATEGFVADWQGAGLIKPSVIKPVIVTIERSMVIKKLGKFNRIGHRITGDRTQATRGIGWEFLFVAIDDHSRIAFTQMYPDERKESAVSFVQAATEYFAKLGVTIERVITDNHLSYRKSNDVKAVIAALGATHKFIRPHCPWQNGKVERFNRTLSIEWAYRQVFTSNTDRANALAPWLEQYNTRRRHTALGGLPPISRLSPT